MFEFVFSSYENTEGGKSSGFYIIISKSVSWRIRLIDAIKWANYCRIKSSSLNRMCSHLTLGIGSGLVGLVVEPDLSEAPLVIFYSDRPRHQTGCLKEGGGIFRKQFEAAALQDIPDIWIWILAHRALSLLLFCLRSIKGLASSRCTDTHIYVAQPWQTFGEKATEMKHLLTPNL